MIIAVMRIGFEDLFQVTDKGRAIDQAGEQVEPRECKDPVALGAEGLHLLVQLVLCFFELAAGLEKFARFILQRSLGTETGISFLLDLFQEQASVI